MIGVLADDFTGAAELGALGWRLGLRAEVALLTGAPAKRHQDDSHAAAPTGQAAARRPGQEACAGPDLLCVDSDSRLRTVEDAAERAVAGALHLRAAGAEWIYKKVDSVLRGHVTAEIEALLALLKLPRALLLPANPGLGRTIRNGEYFVNGLPIHETEFARDPDYPRRTARVLDLLATSRNLPACVRRPGEPLPETGLIVCEAGSPEDLRLWAGRCPADALPAGGAEFFGALLSRCGLAGTPMARAEVNGGSPVSGGALFVCGSPSQAAERFVARAAERGVAVFSLPREQRPGGLSEPEWVAALAGRVATALAERGRAILGIGPPLIAEPAVSRRLTRQLTDVAARVLKEIGACRVYAEGGATAVALARRLGWTRFVVRGELAPGVAWLAPAGAAQFGLAVKPGSYAWPTALEEVGTGTPKTPA